MNGISGMWHHVGGGEPDCAACPWIVRLVVQCSSYWHRVGAGASLDSVCLVDLRAIPCIGSVLASYDCKRLESHTPPMDSYSRLEHWVRSWPERSAPKRTTYVTYVVGDDRIYFGDRIAPQSIGADETVLVKAPRNTR
jgi:hypothetical protein